MFLLFLAFAISIFFFLSESSNLHFAKGGEAISDQTFGQMSQVNQSPSHDFDLKTFKSQNLHQTPPESEKLQFKMNFNFGCQPGLLPKVTRSDPNYVTKILFTKILFCIEH